MSHRFLAALLVPAAAVAATAALAASSSLMAGDAWARPTPPGAATGGVYLTVMNHGHTADALVSVSSPAADKAEFHSMTMTGGVMSMRPITAPIPLPPGGVIRFAPGGQHIMLIGLKAPLKEGGRVPLTLTFQKGGKLTVEAKVGTAAPAQGGHGMPDMKM
ncbi:MAG TPA: copper chaperone PCu(A)C [Caulobacteraceae bacterium]|nr:copper chaperone PCu(A)C [Caulobacteraceae bacterium]